MSKSPKTNSWDRIKDAWRDRVEDNRALSRIEASMHESVHRNDQPTDSQRVQRFIYDHAPNVVREWMDNRTLNREAEARMEALAAGGDKEAIQWLSKEPMDWPEPHATVRQGDLISMRIEDDRQMNLWQQTMEVGRQARSSEPQAATPQMSL